MNALLQKNFISTKEASQLSGYNADYLSRLCREKRIAGSQIGRTWLIERSSLETFMEAQVDRKVEFAENLARERELEYRRANSPAARISKVTDDLEERMRTVAESVFGALSVVRIPREMPEYGGRAVALGLTAFILGASVTLAGSGVVARAGEVLLASAFDARSFALASASSMARVAEEKSAVLALASKEELEKVETTLTHANDVRVAMLPVELGKSLAQEHPPVEVSNVAYGRAQEIYAQYPRVLSSAEIATHVTRAVTHPEETLSAIAEGAVHGYVSMGAYALNDIETILTLHMRAVEAAGDGLHTLSVSIRDTAYRAPLAVGNVFVQGSETVTSLYEDALYAYVENIDMVPKTILGAVYHIGNTSGAVLAGGIQLAPVAYEGAVLAFAETTSSAGTLVANGSYAFGKGANEQVAGLTEAQDRVIAQGVEGVRVALRGLGGRATQMAAVVESAPAAASNEALLLAGEFTLRVENTGTQMLMASPLASLDFDRFIPGFVKNITAVLAHAIGSAFHGIFGPLAGFFGASEQVGLAVIPGDSTLPGSNEAEGTDVVQGDTINYNGPVTVIRNEYPTVNYGGVPQSYVDERFDFLRRTLYNRIEDVAGDRTFRGDINNSRIVESSISESGFSNGTITDSEITGGTITGSVLDVATTTVTGTLTVNGDLSVSGTVIGNSTSTNLYATNGTIDNLLGTNATITNATTTNFYATVATIVDGFFTNLTATLANITTAVIANLTATDAVFTNATTTNATSTNLFATNATTTNFFATSAGFTTAFIDALTSPLANITTAVIANLTATDASFTNATSTGSLALTYVTPSRLLSVGGAGEVVSTTLSSWVTGTMNQLTVTDNGTGGITLSLPSTIVIGSSEPTTIASNGATSTFGGGLQATFVEGMQYLAGPYVLATSTTATSAFSGNIAVGRNTTLGTTAADFLTVNSSISSNLIPSANNTYDIGSVGNNWNRIYVDEIVANNISAASTSISGTVSESFTINSDNASADAEDSSLVFNRGSASPNALITWNAATDRFEFNMPVFSADGIFTNATSTNLVATNFTINGETFTDLTGTNLTNTGGALGLSASYAGQSSITTLGTISSGTWNGSTIGVPYGGTGATSLTGLLIGNGTSPFTATTLSSGIAGQISDETGTGSLVFNDSPTFTGTSVFANLAATNATSTNFATTNFTLGGSTFTSLLGAGLSNVGGALTADIASLAGSFFQQGGNSFGATAVLGTNDSNSLALETGGTTRLTIDTSGNVGIGTTTPTSLLDLYKNTDGYAKITVRNPNTGTDALSGIEFVQDIGGIGSLYTTGNTFDGNADFGALPGYANTLWLDASFELSGGLKLVARNGDIGFYAGSRSTQNVTISGTNGNLGVGSTTPLARLSVKGVGTTASTIAFQTTDSSNVPGVTITDNGRFMMGTTTSTFPAFFVSTGSQTLVAQRDSSATSLTSGVVSGGAFRNADTTNNNYSSLQFLGVDGSGAGQTFGHIANVMTDHTTSSIDSDFAFILRNSNALTEVMRIKGTGNVGIGETAPTAKLHLKTSVGAAATNLIEPALVLESTATAGVSVGPSLMFKGQTGNSTARYSFAAIQGIKESATASDYSGALVFSTQNSGGATALSEHMRITGAGNVGIGTVAPFGKFQIGTPTGANTNILSNEANIFGAYNINGPTLGLFTTNAATAGIGGSIAFGGEGGQASSPYVFGRIMGAKEAGGTYNGYLAFFTTPAGSQTDSERMRINSAGNVGIGATNPDSPLEISASPSGSDPLLKLTRTSSGQEWGFSPDTNNFNIVDYTNAPSTPRLTITTAGNVGIGTTNPGTKLQVSGDITIDTDAGVAPFRNLLIGGHRNSYSTDAPAIFTSSGGGSGMYSEFGNLIIAGRTNASNGDVFIATGNDGNAQLPRLVVTKSGNIGIGTTNPGAKLVVAGANATLNTTIGVSSLADLRSTSVATTNTGPLLTFSGYYNASTNTSTYGSIQGVLLGPGDSSSAAGGLTFLTANSAGANSERMRIDSSGNVGIGDTTPDAKLDIRQASDTSAQGLQISRSNDTDYTRLYMSAGVGSLSDTLIFNTSFGGDVAAIGRDGSAYFAGNVGVGTASPANKLSVVQASGVGRVIASFANTNRDRQLEVVQDISGDATSYIGLNSRENGSTGGRDFVLQTGGGERMRIAYTTGFIGIGTTNPVDKFTVEVATNKRIGFEEVTSSSIADFSSGASAIQFSRPNDGANNLNAIFTYNDGGGETNLALAARNDLVFAAGSGSTYNLAPERMRIDAGGNVGIGTANPAAYQRLTVGDTTASSGGVQLLTSATSFSIVPSNSAGGGTSITNSFVSGGYGPITISNGGAVAMSITSLARVGIGTTNPTEKLQVVGGNIKVANGFNMVFGDVSQANGFQIGNVGGGNDALINQVNNSNIIINTSNTERLRIANTGYVGIGVSNPTNGRLQVAGFVGNWTSYLSGHSTTGQSYGVLIDAGTNTSDSAFRIRSYAGADYLHVRGDGNVGVGTVSPAYRLDVLGGAGLGARIGKILILDDSPFVTGANITSGSNQLGIGTGGAAGVFFLTNNATRMGIDASGNVRLYAYGAGTLVTDASGNVTASSDERLKNIEGEFARGLDDLMAINPINYRWKESTGFDTVNTYSGFSAQDVQDAIPEAIDTDPRGYLTLTDRPILAASVNAIKELNLRTLALAPAAENQEAYSLAVSSDASIAGMLTVTGIGTFSDALTAASVFSSGSVTATSFLTEDNDSLPSEVLTGGNADLYKMANYAITGMQALAERTDLILAQLDTIESRLAAIEQSQSAEPNFLGISPDMFKNLLAGVGIAFDQGITSIEKLVAERLTVGSVEKPTGITLYDEETGEPYCLSIGGGSQNITQGECQIATPNTPQVVPVPVPPPTEPEVVEDEGTPTPPEEGEEGGLEPVFPTPGQIDPESVEPPPAPEPVVEEPPVAPEVVTEPPPAPISAAPSAPTL